MKLHFDDLYSLSNNCTKNYYNRTLTVQVIVEDVVAWIFLRHSVFYLFQVVVVLVVFVIVRVEQLEKNLLCLMFYDINRSYWPQTWNLESLKFADGYTHISAETGIQISQINSKNQKHGWNDLWHCEVVSTFSRNRPMAQRLNSCSEIQLAILNNTGKTCT